jgi:hypothetical protein
LSGATSTGTIRACSAAAFIPFCGDNQLQQFFWIVEKLVRRFGIHAERARRDLCRDCRLGDRRIGRHKTDFIDMNVMIALQRRFQLFGKLCGLRSAAGGKPTDEFCEAGLRDIGREVNARDSRGGEHFGKTLLRSRGLQGHAIQQKLVSRHCEEKACLVVAKRSPQFRPGGFVLLRRAWMPEIIHTGELKENIQAADERASRRGPGVGIHSHDWGGSPASAFKYEGWVRIEQWYWCPFRYYQLVLSFGWERGSGCSARFPGSLQPRFQLANFPEDGFRAQLS